MNKTKISPSEWEEVVERFAGPIMALKFLNYIYYGLSSWLKQKNELTFNRETERLHEYATGKASHMVSELQGRPVSATQISSCEWHHIKHQVSESQSILVASWFEFHRVSTTLGLVHTCRQNLRLTEDKSPILSVDCCGTNPTWSGIFCRASTPATCLWTIAELSPWTEVHNFVYNYCVLSLTDFSFLAVSPLVSEKPNLRINYYATSLTEYGP